ncbi:MAG: DNA/RNA nuclease SfsA [Clostridia bacterium]|nr:DNA/RNA nuclease SfsA [Clostridia bacterium]
MRYANIHEATFRRRLNRFVAEVEIGGAVERVHVKNTGRCAELLVPGYRVYLEESGNPGRRTAYDLVAVEKRTPQGPKLINMDSMAPNKAVAEWLAKGGLGPLEDLRGEVTVGDSRFDFVAQEADWMRVAARQPMEAGAVGRPVAIEVKGCTLESDGVARFPDAPTLRGLKHVRGLTALSEAGWRCAILIVIQMKGVDVFRPNWRTQPEFGAALIAAREAGVEIVALDCDVAPGMVAIDAPVRVILEDDRE